jgi:hypothetical protein
MRKQRQAASSSDCISVFFVAESKKLGTVMKAIARRIAMETCVGQARIDQKKSCYCLDELCTFVRIS